MKEHDPRKPVSRGNDPGEEPTQDPTLQELEKLREVPARSPEAHAAGRAAFLAEAQTLAQAVSPPFPDRLKRWINLKRKEAKPMIVAARIALILGLLFGGTGATAVAAQASAPSDLLYPVKLATEDLRLALTQDAEEEISLLLGMVDERVEEIQQLAAEGIQVPVNVSTRLQIQLEMAIQRAAKLDDPELIQAMEQIQVRTQEHIQLFKQTQENASENADEALQLAEQILANVRVQAEGAIANPTAFRLQLNTERLKDAPGEGNGAGEAGESNSEDCEPVPGEANGCSPGPGEPQGEGKQQGKDK